MNKPKQVERETSENKNTGTKIVISGALASIVLWLIVLAVGNPIKPFSSSAESFGYAFAISAPIIILSILAITKMNRAKKKLT